MTRTAGKAADAPMLNYADVKRRVSEVVADRVGRHGFKQTGLLNFSKEMADSEAYLIFGVRKDPRRYFAVTGSLGLRFLRLDDVLGALSAGRIHINVPAHLIGSNPSYREWIIGDVDDVADFGSDLYRVLTSEVLPFLDANTELDRVSERLSSPSPADWYTLDFERRSIFLAAIQYVLGEERTAISTIEHALTALQDALPEKRDRLLYLRRRLQSAGGQA